MSEAFKSLSLSKFILEIAKTGIEKAIEEDEGKAMGWMERELDKLKISI